jgi:hypothetical protein
MKVGLPNDELKHTNAPDQKITKAADVSDEYVSSEISYLDPEQQNEPSNALL